MNQQLAVRTSESRVAIGVAAAGGAGGLASILFAVATDVPTGTTVRGAAIVFLAICAGLVGVYVLANSDRRDLVRCLVFAFLCGFSWKPLLEAGQVYIQTVTRQSSALHQADAAANQAQGLQGAAAGTPSQLAAKIDAASNAAERANQTLPAVATPAAREAVAAGTAKTIDAIADVGVKAPAVASENLVQLGGAAAASGDTANLNRAILHLDRLASRVSDPAQKAAIVNRVTALRHTALLHP